MTDELRKLLIDQMEVLNSREKSILTRAYGLDGSDRLEVKEIAKQEKTSRIKIRQVIRSAMEKLEQAAKGPEYYLYAKLGIDGPNWGILVQEFRKQAAKAAELDDGKNKAVSHLIKAVNYLSIVLLRPNQQHDLELE